MMRVLSVRRLAHNSQTALLFAIPVCMFIICRSVQVIAAPLLFRSEAYTMSSLSATQADGYYVPPEYLDSGQYKKQSRNKFAGSKGHNQYVQRGVVRFELPHDGFCESCGNVVGRGTRYNASKHKAGSYFTTTIFEFRMKCRKCANCTFIIRTNPKERDFDYVQGIHRQVKEFDTNEAGTPGFIETNEGNRIVSCDGTADGHDGLSRLERVASGKRKTMTEIEELQALVSDSNKKRYDDATSNASLRKTFRKDRRLKKERLSHGREMGWSEGMELMDSTTEDTAAARDTCFRDSKQEERLKFKKLRSGSIFSGQRKRKRRRTASLSKPVPDACKSETNVKHSVAVESPKPDTVQSSRATRSTPHGDKKSGLSKKAASSKHALKRKRCSKPVEKQTQAVLPSSLSALASYASSDSD